MADCGVPNACFDLARIRSEAVAATTPLELVSVEVKKRMAQQDLSHSEYGRQLQVPGLDPTIESLDNLHLWHLIEDVDLLYGLLLKQIETWGQPKTLLKHGGVGLVETDDPKYGRAFMTAKVIETACETWRIGRGKDVDREVLLQSGCITENFMDALVDLTNRVNNKAEAVIRALDAGEIKRWRQVNTEKLQSFFESQGYLTTDERLQISDIRVRVMAAVADDLRADRIPKDTVDRILGALSSRSCEE